MVLQQLAVSYYSKVVGVHPKIFFLMGKSRKVDVKILLILVVSPNSIIYHPTKAYKNHILKEECTSLDIV